MLVLTCSTKHSKEFWSSDSMCHCVGVWKREREFKWEAAKNVRKQAKSKKGRSHAEMSSVQRRYYSNENYTGKILARAWTAERKRLWWGGWLVERLRKKTGVFGHEFDSICYLKGHLVASLKRDFISVLHSESFPSLLHFYGISPLNTLVMYCRSCPISTRTTSTPPRVAPLQKQSSPRPPLDPLLTSASDQTHIFPI